MILHGDEAVKAVRKNLGRELTRTERRVVQEEGYSTKAYRDSKKIITTGVGQTGRWIDEGFEAAVKYHKARAKGRVKDFDKLPEYLQAELVQSEYRGDLGGSPKAVRLFNDGEYSKAADEFLNHKEHTSSDTSPGIKKRIKRTAAAIRQFGAEKTKAKPILRGKN